MHSMCVKRHYDPKHHLICQAERFIIVGGAGYIGSHVCKTIHQHGGRPITFDNVSSGHEHAVKWGPFIKVDVRDDASLGAAFAKFPKAEAVIHLASSIEVGLGEKYPAEYYDNNVVGALALLKAMRKAEIDTLIFSSDVRDLWRDPKYSTG